MKRKQDVEKVRYWQRTMQEAARSGVSIREFCRRRKVQVSQFYWWQRRLKQTRTLPTAGKRGGNDRPASFALVSEEAGMMDAGIELVLADGRRLRIRKGVDEETLRAVLAVVEPTGC